MDHTDDTTTHARVDAATLALVALIMTTRRLLRENAEWAAEVREND